MNALINTIKYVKSKWIKGPTGPEDINEDWIRCMQFVLRKVEKSIEWTENRSDIADHIINDAKYDVIKFSKRNHNTINQFLNNWFAAYYLTISIVGHLCD